jgi:glucose/arabinose dehydrogenase
MKTIKIVCIFMAFICSPYAFAKLSGYQDVLNKLQVPKGFQVSVFEDNLPTARSLALGDNGIVYVGTREGYVYAIEDTNQDGAADKRYTIAQGLSMPNGVAYKDGALYVAEINRIIRFDGITKNLVKPPKPVVVYDKFPSDKHHGWKYLRFGPDGKLYTAIGAPCNSCKPDKPYGSLIRLNPDGSQFEIIATGIRNTVGFDWQPETNALFFNEHGRDYLGDDAPPEELNQWSKAGDHFGYPYCHGGKIPDPEFGDEKSCREFIPPVWTYNAHNASLGLRFYRGKQFPAAYHKQLFVALHGSWNRSQPDGYKVILVKFKDDKPVSDETFISGWLTETNEVLGRPVDILELPDGSLLISDDHADLIYRIEYKGK